MGISLKDYIRSMLSKYREYPEMKTILKELYDEWYRTDDKNYIEPVQD